MLSLLVCVGVLVFAGLCDVVIAGLCVGVLNFNRGFWFVYQPCM